MKICFVGHSFHERTRSTVFFKDLLNEIGEVTVLTSSPDDVGLADDDIVSHYLNSDYDRWVFLQTEYVADRLLSLGLRNAVIVPMYDGAWARPDEFFRRFVLSRFVCFSRELHTRLQRLDLRSAAFDFWPEPRPVPERAMDPESWSAYFWERRPLNMPNARVVIDQCRVLGIRKLHIHAVPDFAFEGPGPQGYRFAGNMNGVEVTTSGWFEDPAEHHAVSTTPLFYFAPRLYEGIGMAMLEAMARGQVVIAADRPTANQYFGHLSSGILYDPDRPYELPALSRGLVQELSEGARQRVIFGRAEWEMDRERLKSFILEDGRRWANTDVSAHFGNQLQSAARERRLRARPR